MSTVQKVASIARRHVPVVAAFLVGLADVVLGAQSPSVGHLVLVAVGYLTEFFTSPAEQVGRPTL
jgi:hypothetical protein